MRSWPRFATCVGLALCAAAVPVARAAAPLAAQERPSRSYGVFLSQSFSSATAAERVAGHGSGAVDVLAPVSVTSVEIEVALPLYSGGAWGIEYGARAAPIILIRDNPRDAAISNGMGGWTMPVHASRSSTFGAGVRPAGLRGWVGAARLRAEAEAAAGVVYFGSPVLASNATRFNFVYDFSLGLRVRLSHAEVAVGFRRHHLSNAGMGEVNPGLNSHMGYLGIGLR